MFEKIFSANPFTTFYVVFAYILIFSFWWAYLLYDKNETAFKEKIELNQIRYQQFNEKPDYTLSDDYIKVHSKYLRQRFMIITEGTAFILLLLFGLLRVRKVFLREMKLASQQRNFLLSITHELKSPLSTIKLSLQTLAKRKLEPDKSEALISNSLIDVDRLESLVDNILFAAKIDREEPGLGNEEVNISELTQHACKRFLHNKKSIGIETDIQPEIYLCFDPMGFTSVVTNLLDNAIKYSEVNTSVKVELKENDGKVFLNVTDKGAGIPAEEKERVFEKFYRIGNEDTRKTKGTGLGLFIIKRIAEIYNGSIVIKDNPTGGSVFKLIFPR